MFALTIVVLRGLLLDSDFFSSTEVLSGTLRPLYHGDGFHEKFFFWKSINHSKKYHPDCLCLVTVPISGGHYLFY
jgi:hypothetical protein